MPIYRLWYYYDILSGGYLIESIEKSFFEWIFYIPQNGQSTSANYYTALSDLPLLIMSKTV